MVWFLAKGIKYYYARVAFFIEDLKERYVYAEYNIKANMFQRKLARNGLIHAEGVFDDLFAPQLNDAYISHGFKDLSDLHDAISIGLRLGKENYGCVDLLDSVFAPEVSLKEAHALIDSPLKWRFAKGCDKLNAIKSALYETCGGLGIDPPKLYGTWGSNNDGICFDNGTISVNLEVPAAKLVLSVKHETFHQYQRLAMEGMLSKNSPQPSKEKIADWQQPYISMSENAFRYKQQPLEADATEFALKDMLKKKYKLTKLIHKFAKSWGFSFENSEHVGRAPEIKGYASDVERDRRAAEVKAKANNAVDDFIETELSDRVGYRLWLEKIKRERTEQGRQMEPIDDLPKAILSRIPIKKDGVSITHKLPKR